MRRIVIALMVITSGNLLCWHATEIWGQPNYLLHYSLGVALMLSSFFWLSHEES